LARFLFVPSPVVLFNKKDSKTGGIDMATMCYPYKNQINNKYPINPDAPAGSNVVAICSLEGLVNDGNRDEIVPYFQRVVRVTLMTARNQAVSLTILSWLLQLKPIFQQLVQIMEHCKAPESPFEEWETLEGNADRTVSSLILPLVFRASLIWGADIRSSKRPPLVRWEILQLTMLS